mmetsp:Transcript_103686/g.178598  ORF Transcript_103686/g.178598 Transcript_103686/m.178598 type:complete len:119 (+) Transcript_103686:3486-3842(+)
MQTLESRSRGKTVEVPIKIPAVVLTGDQLESTQPSHQKFPTQLAILLPRDFITPSTNLIPDEMLKRDKHCPDVLSILSTLNATLDHLKKGAITRSCMDSTVLHLILREAKVPHGMHHK